MGAEYKIGRWPVNEGYAMMLGVSVVLNKLCLYAADTDRGYRLLEELVCKTVNLN